MTLYFKAFSSIDIDALTTIHFYQLEGAKSFNLNIFVFFKPLFYYREKFFYKNLSIFPIDVVVFSQFVSKILYVKFFVHRIYLNLSFNILLGRKVSTIFGGTSIRCLETGLTDIRSDFFLITKEPKF